MTLWEFVSTFDDVHPLEVLCYHFDGVTVGFYENSADLIDKNEVGVYDRLWDLDEDIVERITINENGVVTVQVKEV